MGHRLAPEIIDRRATAHYIHAPIAVYIWKKAVEESRKRCQEGVERPPLQVIPSEVRKGTFLKSFDIFAVFLQFLLDKPTGV